MKLACLLPEADVCMVCNIRPVTRQNTKLSDMRLRLTRILQRIVVHTGLAWLLVAEGPMVIEMLFAGESHNIYIYIS